ncbi:tetratricopeptide repeat protein [Rhodothermus bifroesti]|jgi:tetratricopeptide (TPR) repeat protein|uniref:Tetratricopeptide repeat protein n=1 Tax=Rhodothermus marinus TaxID=29549 RepID=A0A7V2F558_RHOMR|nr:tetratricopeptide repeat protein [Rhodothermus bifroesti]GBD00754.1 hypothetical protein HRbin18_00468 [bacterium HR18]
MQDNLKALLLQGEDHFLQGSYVQALHLFERVLREDPDNTYALNDAGLAYAELGQIEKAVECFEYALHCDPTHERAFYNLLDVLMKYDFWDLAQEAYHQYKSNILDGEERIKYKSIFEDQKALVEESSQVVIILGMHRSGTSTISRILNLLGVYLGEAEDFLKPAPDNPKGFWENKFFVEVNDEILRRLGSPADKEYTWSEPPIFYEGWERSNKFRDLKFRVIEFINKNMSKYKIWGWKDPRTCLTLPFWKDVIPNDKIKYVVCLRNPLSVAKSLQKRNNFPLEKGLKLWFKYNMLILKNIRSSPKIIVNYEDVLNDKHRNIQIEKIKKFIGIKHKINLENINSFVEENMSHYHHNMQELLHLNNVNPMIKFLYFSLYVVSKHESAYVDFIFDIISEFNIN